MKLTDKVIAASVGMMLLGVDAAVADAGLFSQSLGNLIGATDSYRISCPANQTDHLNFKIKDTTPASGGEMPSMLLNIHVKKKVKVNKQSFFVTQDETAVAPGGQREFYVEAGKGSYKISVDTAGTTDTSKQKKHAFSVETHCLNDADEFTKPAIPKVKKKTIKNSTNPLRPKKASMSASCGKSKTSGDTTRLYVKFTNTTNADPSRVVLNAQVLKDTPDTGMATNLTDGNGDDAYSGDANLKGGSGDYTVLVNSTAFDSQQNNARDYTMEYRCENSANEDAGSAEIVQIQNE